MERQIKYNYSTDEVAILRGDKCRKYRPTEAAYNLLLQVVDKPKYQRRPEWGGVISVWVIPAGEHLARQ